MDKTYKVGASIFNSRRVAIECAINWWATACGTQAANWGRVTEDELDQLRGWCKLVGGSKEEQEELDKLVIEAARAKLDEYDTPIEDVRDLEIRYECEKNGIKKIREVERGKHYILYEVPTSWGETRVISTNGNPVWEESLIGEGVDFDDILEEFRNADYDYPER